MRYRSTVAVINLPNIYQNYKNVSKLVGNKIVIPVVKANAYGHGAVEVTKYLHERGIDYFAVSLLEEAIELRDELPDIDLLCMGIVENVGLLIAIEKNITVTISNLKQIDYLYKMNEIYKNVQESKNLRHTINFVLQKTESKSESEKLTYFQNEMKNFLVSSDIHENLHNLILDIQSMKILIRMIETNKKFSNLKVHLKIDTGMNRLGFKYDDEILDSFHRLVDHPFITLQGIYTHFSTADVDKSYYDIQMNRFKDVFAMLDYPFEMVHISNSSSQIKYEHDIPFTTHTRLGISLYGLTLDSDNEILHNTFKLVTKISQLKELRPGDKVGYGATYTALTNEIIAVLPIGYADGFIRKNQNGFVEIHNKRYQIVGRICMDQCFVKVDHTIKIDDDVVLFGQLITIDEVAERLETINYEIICQITDRVPREYIREKGRGL